MSKFITVVNALIKNKENKFLIIKRNSTSSIHPSKWAFPGGMVEQGESILEALKREIKEETNLEIENNIKKISEYQYSRQDNSTTLGSCYEVKAKTDNVIINEESEVFKWITPKELKNYDYLKWIKQEVEKAYKKLNK